MSGLCYIHNDNSCLYNDNILVAQASTVFNVCRCDKFNFKIYRCKQCHNKIHIYIKNYNCKSLNNVAIRLNIRNQFIDVGCLLPCENKCFTIDVCNVCPGHQKIMGELLIGNDVIANVCMIL